MTLKVVSLNIEFDKHLDTVIPFLQKEQADIILLNEVLEPDLERLKSALGMQSFYVPQMIFTRLHRSDLFGQAVFSALPFSTRSIPYAGVSEVGKVLDHPFVEVAAQRYQLVMSTITKDRETFTIGLTHFPWTRDGEADDFQRDALQKLFTVMAQAGDMALFGDFNAPRGREIFTKLKEKFTDNIPLSYAGSLDSSLHRVGKEKFFSGLMDTYMVDGCFTTSGYTAENVRLAFGVSDHAAVIADIKKVS